MLSIPGGIREGISPLEPVGSLQANVSGSTPAPHPADSLSLPFGQVLT